MTFNPAEDGPPEPYDEMPEHPSARQLARILPSVEQLATIAHQNALAEPIAHRLVEAFSPHFEKAHALVEQAKHITADPKVARAMRLSVREVRLAAENTRKSFKEGIVREGKAIDGICNVVKFLIEPVEERLEGIEKAAERAEAKRKTDLLNARATELSPLGVNPNFYNLAEMPEEQYQEILTTSTEAHKERQRQALAAEIERQNAEIARREEEERTRAENVRLKAERDAAATEAKKTAEAHEESLRLERVAAADLQRKADAVIAKHKRDRDDAQSLLKAEQDAKALADADAKAKAAKAARAPDKVKIIKYAEAIEEITEPEVSDPVAVVLMVRISLAVADLVKWTKREAGTL